MERDDKKELRRRILSLRDGLDAVRKAAWDAAIADNVLRMEEYREADAVLAYASYRGEVDTHGIHPPKLHLPAPGLGQGDGVLADGCHERSAGRLPGHSGA